MPGVSQETHRQKKAIVGTSINMYANRIASCIRQIPKRVCVKLTKLLDSFMGSSCLTKSNIRENHASYLEDGIVDTLTSESSTELKCMLQQAIRN